MCFKKILNNTNPGLLPSRTFATMRTNTIPDIYHPGHLPCPRMFTIPDFYHPGHLPSRTFTIPDIYHPGLLPSRTFTIPCSGSNYPGHLSRGQLSGHHLKVICLSSDNSDKYVYNQVDTSDEICIGSFNKFPLSSEIFTLRVYYKNRYS